MEGANEKKSKEVWVIKLALNQYIHAQNYKNNFDSSLNPDIDEGRCAHLLKTVHLFFYSINLTYA